MRQHFCNKLIQYGKYIDVSDKCSKQNISVNNYFYELQKGIDEIRSKENTLTTYAIAYLKNQGASIDCKKEDITSNMANIKLDKIFQPNSLNGVNNADDIRADVFNLMVEIRNNGFHYLPGGQDNNINNVAQIIQKELADYTKIIMQQIRSNNVLDYYNLDKVSQVVNKSIDTLNVNIDSSTNSNTAYIPGFNKILTISREAGIISNDLVQENADIYLLKNLYIAFISTATKINQNIVDTIEAEYIANMLQPQFENVRAELGDTILATCSNLMNKQNILNSDINTSKSKSKHNNLQIFRDKLVAYHLIYFIKQNYAWFLVKNKLSQSVDDDSIMSALNAVAIPKNYAKKCYVLGRMCDNSLISDMCNGYDKFFQLIEDIMDRGNVAYTDIKEYCSLSGVNLSELPNIRGALRLAIQYNDFIYTTDTIGLSQQIQDTATSELLNKLIDQSELTKQYYNKASQNSNPQEVSIMPLQNIKRIERNLFHNVIIKYLESLSSDNHIRVTASDIEEYYNLLQKDSDGKYTKSNIQSIYAKITAKDTSITLQEWEQLNKYIAISSKVNLQNIADYCKILVEMQSQLISWCFKRERDTYYLMLAYQSLKGGNLEEIKEIFSYNKKHGSVSFKLSRFLDKTANTKAKDLYEKIFKNTKDSGETRNKIDHFKILEEKDISMFNYFVSMYKNVIKWDKKLQNNIFTRFSKILVKYHIDINNNQFNLIGFTNKNNCATIELDINRKYKQGKKELVISDNPERLIEPKELNLLKANKAPKAIDKTKYYALDLLKILTYQT